MFEDAAADRVSAAQESLEAPSAYTLYWYPGTCGRVTYVALQEIGLPYDVVLVRRQGPPDPAYLAINPKNKVPALRIGSRVITETPAILTFLSRRHPDAELLPTEGDAGIEALETLSWFAAGVHPHITRMRFPKFFSDDEAAWPSIRAGARTQLERAFEILEARLEGREWLLGKWSLADVHLLWLWFRASGSGMDGAPYTNCIAHAARCEARPTVAYVLDREEEQGAREHAANPTLEPMPRYQVGRSMVFGSA